MKIKLVLSGALVLSALSLLVIQESFASGGARKNSAPTGKTEETWDKDLMPKTADGYLFDSKSLIDARSEGMRRTELQMKSFSEDRSGLVTTAREYMTELAKASRQSFEKKIAESPSVGSEMEAALRHFREAELQYGYINEEELLQDYWNEMLMKNIHQVLLERYPGKVLSNPEWAFNDVGGTYARFLIVYCHTNEYLGLWGVRTPQYGYSGSFDQVDFWDFIISGEITSHGLDSPHSLRKHFLPPEDGRPANHTLSPFIRGARKISYYAPNTFMMDYARGNILSAFGDGAIKPYLYDAHDWRSLKVQLKSCAESILEQMSTNASNCFGSCFGGKKKSKVGQ